MAQCRCYIDHGEGDVEEIVQCPLCKAAPDLLATCELLQPLAVKHAPHGIDEDYWHICFTKLEQAVAKAKEMDKWIR